MGIKSTDLLPKIQATGAGSTKAQTFQTDTGMFGGIQGKQLSKAGADLGNMAESLRKHGEKIGKVEDMQTSLNVETDITQIESDFFDGEGGVNTRKLGDAKGVTEDLRKKIDKWKSKALKDKSWNTDEGRLRNEASVNQSAVRMMAKAQRIENEELYKDVELKLTTRKDSLVAAGFGDYADDGLIDARRGQIFNNTKALLDHLGVSPKSGTKDDPSIFDTEYAKAISEYNGNVIAGALGTGDTDGLEIAVDIYDKAIASGNLVGKDRNSARKSIMDSGMESTAQELRDEVIEAIPGNLKEQIQYIRDWTSGLEETAGMQALLKFHELDRLPDELTQKIKERDNKNLADERPNKAQSELDKVFVDDDITATKKAIDKVTVGDEKLRKEMYTQAESRHKAGKQTKEEMEARKIKDNTAAETDDPEEALAASLAAKGNTLQERRDFIQGRSDITAKVKKLAVAQLVQADKIAKDKKKADDKVRFDELDKRAEQGDKLKAADMEGLTVREKKYIRAAVLEAEMIRVNPNHDRVGDGGDSWETYTEKSSDFKKWGDVSLEDLKTDYKYNVTGKQWDSILADWKGNRILLGKAKAPKADKGASGMTQIARVKASFSKTGLDWKKKGKDEYIAYHTEFDRRVRDGDVKDHDGQQKILDTMLKEYIVYDESNIWGGSDSKEFAFDMEPDEVEDMAGDMDLSSADSKEFVENWDGILAKLESDGKTATRKNIIAQWGKRRKPAAKANP